MSSLSLIQFNDLKRRLSSLPEVLKQITAVIESGHWIHGFEHSQFETEFANYLGVNNVFGVASGTDALELALRAAGCERNSKVITVANAGGYTSIAAASVGCEILYCDINVETQLIDLSALEQMLSEDIQVVVVTHLYGNVAPTSLVKELCGNFGIVVIEDCAQATGANQGGHKVGSMGDIGTFSFYPTKNLGAIGDGGAVSTNSQIFARRIKELRQYGWTTKYKIDSPGGMNSRLDELQAAVLRIGLTQLDHSNQLRRQILARYDKSLENSSLKLLTKYSSEDVGHLAVVLLSDKNEREKFRKYMLELGIQTEIHYPILDSDQLGLPKNSQIFSLENSINSVGRIVSVPIFPELTEDEINRICDALSNYRRVP